MMRVPQGLSPSIVIGMALACNRNPPNQLCGLSYNWYHGRGDVVLELDEMEPGKEAPRC